MKTVDHNDAAAPALCRYLNGLGPDKARDAVPVALAFTYGTKTETRHGARYLWVGRYDAGMRCVQEGKHKDGEEYTQLRYDLLGLRPKFLQKRKRFFGTYESKVVCRLEGDDGDWYVACWFEGDAASPYHPLGSNFSLLRWPHEEFGQRIDHYDDKPRERCAVTVTVLESSP